MNPLLFLAVASLAGVAVSQRDRDNTLRDCQSKVADIYFVIDSSTSIYTEDYDRVLDFVRQVAGRFDMSNSAEDGGRATRVAALTFSDSFDVGFELDRYQDKDQVQAAMTTRNLPYRTGITNTHLAIQYVRENRQFRSDITKVMVVITDGGSRSPGQTRFEADKAREAGFHMVVVGVGTYLEEQEWRYIASDPDNDYLFNITNFNALNNLIDSLPRRVCLMPPIIIDAGCPVSQNADILFLAAPKGLKDAMDLLDRLNSKFDNRQRLNVYYIMEICEDAVDAGFEGAELYCSRFIEPSEPDENTYVDLVKDLRDAARHLESLRPRASQVAVLFVDNLSMRNNRFGILQEVRSLTQFGNMEVVVVDLGVSNYANFLPGMVGNDRDRVVQFDKDDKDRASREILDLICEGINEEGDPFGNVEAT